MKRAYGWRRDLPDQRDFVFTIEKPVPLPSIIDLRAKCPAVYDQAQLGSCTANAIGAAFQFMHRQEGLEDFVPSRLFVYFNERAMENTVRSDAGAVIRDGIKSVAKQGVCPEPQWPYIPERFDIRPPSKCYQDARKHTALRYDSVKSDVDSMKQALAQGFPFVFGFSVYESFESLKVEQTGIVPMPAADESLLGGHAVLAVGYDDAIGCFIVRNSWGPSWGDEGYCYMPYAYLSSQLTSDRWTIRLVK